MMTAYAANTFRVWVQNGDGPVIQISDHVMAMSVVYRGGGPINLITVTLELVADAWFYGSDNPLPIEKHALESGSTPLLKDGKS